MKAGERVARPFDFEPLLGYVSGGVVGLAERIHVERRTVSRHRAAGWLTPWTADRYAVALGLHPAVVWPNWYDEALHDDEAVA
jgi:hypothetical protein